MANNFHGKFSLWLPAIFTLSLAAFSTEGAAQTSTKFNLEYPLTVPYQETSDFIQETSYSGMGFSFFLPSNTNFTYGLGFQWFGWDQSKDFGELDKDGQYYVGAEHKKYDAYPMQLQVRYQIGDALFQPYAGAGLGVAYIEQYEKVDTASVDTAATQGAASGELGILMSFQKAELGVGATYLAGFADSDDDVVRLDALAVKFSVGMRAF